MIANNLHEKIVSSWGEHLKTIKNLSRRNDTAVPLVNSDVLMYDFDTITRGMFRQDRLPASADGILVSERVFEFVEFKSGFKKRITRANFDKSKVSCPQDKGYCQEYGELMLKKLDIETAELISSIKAKAVESYITLEKQIIPTCNVLCKGASIEIKLTIVIDEDSTDNMEDTLAELANQQAEPNNCYEQIRSALRKFKNQKDASLQDYFYDDIEVISAMDFYHRVEKIGLT